MGITIEQKIKTLLELYHYIKGDTHFCGYIEENAIQSLETAIDTMRKYQKIFDKYEILTASFEDSDSPEVRSKKVDEFCIDTMRGLLGEYYAERIGYETNEKRSD